MSRPRKGDDLIRAALAQGKTHAEAARIAGVSDRTVRRRLQDPQFAAGVERARAEVTAAAASQLASLYSKAIGAVSEMLEHEEGPVRLRAAQIVLKSGPEFRAHTDLWQRLVAMEESVRNRW